jgi:ribonuclease E
MLESELYDREDNDHTEGGRGTGELNAPAPSVPAAVFQPPQVVFHPPAIRSEPAPASQPSGSSRPAGTPGNGEPAGEGGTDDDAAGTGRRRRRRPSRSRARNGDQDAAAEAGETPAGQDGDGVQGSPSVPDAEAAQDQPEAPRPRTSRTRSRRASTAQERASAAQERASAAQERASAAAEGQAAEGQAAEGPAESAEDAGPEDSADDADSADRRDGEAGTVRRRRRKRRRGSADGPASSEPAADDPPDTVVHVREPNGPAGTDDVRSVKGSTRLEAKKQRRREGRETGRRRPPVITESEFLARRESVERTMVVRQRKDRTQIAVLEDGVLVEHYVNRSSHQSYVGNVYLGKVQNVLPSMEAAFVDVGKGRNAVLYAGEVNFDVSGLEGQPKRIESALKAGQSLIVQVTKDPVGHKGARLTSQVSLPGRYLVYVPGASMTGISRKLPDTERNRLKQILRKVMPENAGVIVRTAAEGAAEEELSRDVARLAAQWEAIEKKAKTASAPALLYSEPDLTIRVIRDVFNEDFNNLVVSGDDGWDTVDEYVRYVAPHLADRLTRWQDNRDVFGAYRVDEQLAKALERKVWLPSGGSLVIDKTEAMTVIDVNTGKFTGQGGNLEETVTRNNLEAAEEIVRQLRLRDVGGIVVIDFIDMVLESNRELVLRRLLECLARDRTKHQVAEVTSLGLVQMTRKRVGAGLLEAFSVPCECCNGRGVIITFDPEADAQASHHVHARGAGNGGNGGSRGSGGAASASPATVAARVRPDGQAPEPTPADGQPADTQQADAQQAAAQQAAAQPADGQRADSQHGAQEAAAQPADGQHVDAQLADGQQAAAAAIPAGRSDGQAQPPRSGNGRRRRRRSSGAAASVAAAASAASAASTATAPPPTPTATAPPATAPPAAVSTSAAPEAPAVPEAPAASPASQPEPQQAQDGAA